MIERAAPAAMAIAKKVPLKFSIRLWLKAGKILPSNTVRPKAMVISPEPLAAARRNSMIRRSRGGAGVDVTLSSAIAYVWRVERSK